MEIERGLGLIDQRRDVADIDRLMQVHKLAVLAQAVEKLAEIFLHCPKTFRYFSVTFCDFLDRRSN